jgi:hypothetical protein
VIPLVFIVIIYEWVRQTCQSFNARRATPLEPYKATSLSIVDKSTKKEDKRRKERRP